MCQSLWQHCAHRRVLTLLRGIALYRSHLLREARLRGVAWLTQGCLGNAGGYTGAGGGGTTVCSLCHMGMLGSPFLVGALSQPQHWFRVSSTVPPSLIEPPIYWGRGLRDSFSMNVY